jgi:hypothetical protein
MGANGRIASQVILKEWKKPAAQRQSNGAPSAAESVTPASARSAKESN